MFYKKNIKVLIKIVKHFLQRMQFQTNLMSKTVQSNKKKVYKKALLYIPT